MWRLWHISDSVKRISALKFIDPLKDLFQEDRDKYYKLRAITMYIIKKIKSDGKEDEYKSIKTISELDRMFMDVKEIFESNTNRSRCKVQHSWISEIRIVREMNKRRKNNEELNHN